MNAQLYWNEIGSKKSFEDPLFLDKLAPFITLHSRIIEYGCGYGRMLRLLKNAGYDNLIGFDYAPKMIERGNHENPDLELKLINTNFAIPCDNDSVDAIVMSTILCSIINKNELFRLLNELKRVLKKNGIVYISDFLISEHSRYKEKYELGFKQFGTWGIYTTNENLVVRHFTVKAILDLLSPFEIQWFEQIDFKTMNQNPARTFHCIVKK